MNTAQIEITALRAIRSLTEKSFTGLCREASKWNECYSDAAPPFRAFGMAAFLAQKGKRSPNVWLEILGRDESEIMAAMAPSIIDLLKSGNPDFS